MKNKFHGKKAHGEFLLTDDNFSELLDMPVEFIDYVMARRSDRRMSVRVKTDNKPGYAVKMTAAAFPRTDEDRENYSPEFGAKLVELKLHRKALRLLEAVRGEVAGRLKECAERIRQFKPADPPFTTEDFGRFESPVVDTMHLTSGTSCAYCLIPIKSVEGVVDAAVGRLAAFMIGHKGISAFDRLNVYDFCDSLGETVKAEIGPEDFGFIVVTRRNPADPDDPEAAVDSMRLKLVRKWNKLNLDIYKAMARTLESKIVDVSEFSKARSRSWRRMAKRCEKKCRAFPFWEK